MKLQIEEIQNTMVRVTPTNVKAGDYVFATKYLDADPQDRWRVDIVEKVILEPSPCIIFKESGLMKYYHFNKITGKEGELILNTWQEVYP